MGLIGLRVSVHLGLGGMGLVTWVLNRLSVLGLSSWVLGLRVNGLR